ncbi:MAG TPA: FIST N-terminal domain-containing protein, partial [Bacteroidales bacterium]|nr:FIST N-terminal domain-containing protein [Bacteroidales bacterium]
MLVQIFSGNDNPEWYSELRQSIKHVFPSAVVVGVSAVGEINEGQLNTDSTLLSFSFFESTCLHLFSSACSTGDEIRTGKSLYAQIEELEIKIKGVLLLTTPVSSDSTSFFKAFTENHPDYPIFGGGAGDYANERKTLVFDGTNCFSAGVVAVTFSGEAICIEPHTYLGWIPLTQEMTITKIENLSVKTIDGNPAFSVFKKYLGLQYSNQFFQNVLEFPFLIQRNGQTIARVPFFVNMHDDSIEFLADIYEGEKFRIGYGNPQNIIEEAVHIQKRMDAFQPQAIFLYSCICRRFLMQNDVELETLPFAQIAPTAGFYTFGEFFSDGNVYSLLNSTMVAVGMREGEPQNKQRTSAQVCFPGIDNSTDPYAQKHARILSHLLHFIKVTISELEDQNERLKALNEQKNEFLGIAAHDLRNPLWVIQGFSELLQDKIDDKYKPYTTMITTAITGMVTLLNDLLDISKIEAGKLGLKLELTEYISMVRQNLKMNEFVASEKKIRIVESFDQDQLFVSIDRGKIEQVLNNLVGNAIKYSHAGTTIVVNVFKTGTQITTEVIDQGIGIKPDEIDRIFYPFKRSSNRPTSNESSHGLGLAIVKKIVEGHGGTVGV